MFNTYLSIEERMDRESWSEDDGELLERALPECEGCGWQVSNCLC